MENLSIFEKHVTNGTSVTQPAPTEVDDFFLRQNTDRYLVAIQQIGVLPVKTNLWLLYKTDENISSADQTLLSIDDNAFMSNQGQVIPDTTSTDYRTFIIPNTGAYGIYLEVTQGEAHIMVSDNKMQIDN